MRIAGMILVLAATSSFAATYRWVDAQGVVHYSDTPQPGAQQIQLPPAQTYRAPPIAPTATSTPAAPANAAYSCSIAQPGPEETLFAQDSISVSVQIAPNRRSGDHVVLEYDGASLTPDPPDGLSFQISPADRGEHKVSATVRDAGNNVVCTTPSVTFYVRQPSILSPQSPQAPKSATAPTVPKQ